VKKKASLIKINYKLLNSYRIFKNQKTNDIILAIIFILNLLKFRAINYLLCAPFKELKKNIFLFGSILLYEMCKHPPP